MTKQFKPMLAGSITTFEDLTYPVYASTKLDGIRCVVMDGRVLSRSLKPIPNKYITSILSQLPYPQLKGKEKIIGYDGELLLADTKATFSEVTSVVMSEDKKVEFVYHIFDVITDEIFEDRLSTLEELLSISNHKIPDNLKKYLSLLEQIKIKNPIVLSKLEDKLVKAGKEGVMVRSPVGLYKRGRSTVNEEYLLKYKRFAQDEALVIGFTEKMTNNNPKEVSELGNSKRAHKKEFLAPAGTLGALKVVNINTKVEFEIGTGFDDELRQEIWNNRDKYLEKVVTYKYQECGMKDKVPRFPVLIGFRSKDDM